ncbi:MAG: LapA family protein [Pseudomonadota bacterium]
MRLIRAVKYLFLAVIALALVVLALANREVVTLEVFPEGISTWVGWSFSINLPLFVVILGGVVAGLAIGFVWEWLRESRIRAEASRQRRANSKLAKEIESLRSETDEGRDEVLALLDNPGRAS